MNESEDDFAVFLGFFFFSGRRGIWIGDNEEARRVGTLGHLV